MTKQKTEIIIKFTEMSRYMQLKAQGYKTAWVGEGKICLVKEKAKQ